MSRHSDDRLVAYLDGEIEGADEREIEAWLDSDPVARDKFAALAKSADLLRQAYDEVLREPVPGAGQIEVSHRRDAAARRKHKIRNCLLDSPAPSLRRVRSPREGAEVSVRSRAVICRRERLPLPPRRSNLKERFQLEKALSAFRAFSLRLSVSAVNLSFRHGESPVDFY